MNPQIMLNKILNNNQFMNNPMFANAMNMYKQNDIKGLQELAQKIAKEKGTDINKIRSQIGL